MKKYQLIVLQLKSAITSTNYLFNLNKLENEKKNYESIEGIMPHFDVHNLCLLMAKHYRNGHL